MLWNIVFPNRSRTLRVHKGFLIIDILAVDQFLGEAYVMMVAIDFDEV